MGDILRPPRDRRKVREVPPSQISWMKPLGWLRHSVVNTRKRQI
jgi:hypothetical protein